MSPIASAAATAPAELRERGKHGFGLLRELAHENIAEVLLESDAAQPADRIVADLAHHDADCGVTSAPLSL